MRTIIFALLCCVATSANAVEYLKQSTAVNVQFGPFVDSIDGVTPETGLTISQADIRLSKNGGDFAQTNNATGATPDENGYYVIPLDATDTNTPGRLRIAVNEAGAAPLRADFLVVPENTYESLVIGSESLIVDGSEVVTDLLATARVGSPTAGTYGELFEWLHGTFESDGVYSAAALAEAPTGSGSGLTAQQTRDAMKLAPSAGAAASGSVDDLLAGIREDTESLQVDVGNITPGTVETRDLQQVAHLFELVRTSTGALQSKQTHTLYVYPGDQDIRFGFNCDIPFILPGNAVLATMGDPASTNADFTLTKLGIGPNGNKGPYMVAKGELDVAADATAGTYWITATVSNDAGGGPITLYGKVIVQEAP